MHATATNSLEIWYYHWCLFVVCVAVALRCNCYTYRASKIIISNIAVMSDEWWWHAINLRSISPNIPQHLIAAITTAITILWFSCLQLCPWIVVVVSMLLDPLNYKSCWVGILSNFDQLAFNHAKIQLLYLQRSITLLLYFSAIHLMTIIVCI